MGLVHLIEPFAIRNARKLVAESLQAHGEEVIGLSMYHPVIDDEHPRCPNCYDPDYKQGDPSTCTVCYGTGFDGGVKRMGRMWAMFDDSPEVEEQVKRGVWHPTTRGIQLESHPQLIEHDYLFQVNRWSKDHRPLELGGAYIMDQVTNQSLRTGNQLAQRDSDRVGQKGRCHRLDTSHLIYKTHGRIIASSFSIPRLDRTQR